MVDPYIDEGGLSPLWTRAAGGFTALISGAQGPGRDWQRSPEEVGGYQNQGKGNAR